MGMKDWSNIEKSTFAIYHLNRLNKKIHMIEPIDAWKAFDIQHPFMTKMFTNLGIEFINLIKNVYKILQLISYLMMTK